MENDTGGQNKTNKIIIMEKNDFQNAEPLDRVVQARGGGEVFNIVEPSVPNLDEYWLDLDGEDAPLEFLFVMGEDHKLLARGNVQTIAGREKTGKSFFGVLLNVAGLNGEFLGVKSVCPDMRVLWVDTEQDERTLREKALKMWEMAGIPRQDDRVNILTLKKAEITERLELMLLALEEVKPDFVFLDGVADLCLNFNDNQECAGLVNRLIQVAEQYNCAILCVNHVTRGTNESRGHLGAILQQKSSEVYLMKRDKRSPEATVTQDSSRFADVPDICFRFGEGFSLLPSEGSKPKDEKRATFAKLFESTDTYSHTRLCEAYQQQTRLGKEAAKKHIAEAVKEGILRKEKKGRYTSYSLIQQREEHDDNKEEHDDNEI